MLDGSLDEWFTLLEETTYIVENEEVAYTLMNKYSILDTFQ